MAIIFDECEMIVPEFLTFSKCAVCGVVFREDESDWWSLCQEHGEEEAEQEREQP